MFFLENFGESEIDRTISIDRFQDLREYIIKLDRDKRLERHLDIGMDIIDQSAYFLGLDENIKARSVEIFERMCRLGVAKGRSIYLLTLASLYSACRENKLPVSLNDIALVTDTPKKDLARTFRVLLRKAKIRLPLIDPNVFIDRYSDEMNIESITQELALALLGVAHERRMIAGRDPAIIAVALLYTAGLYTNNRFTQDELSKKANATPVSIRNYYKNFLEVVDSNLIYHLKNLLENRDSVDLREQEKVWNKYLIYFRLISGNSNLEKSVKFSSFHEILSDTVLPLIYLDKSHIVERNENEVDITLILWVNVSIFYSFVVPQNLNFKLNEIFGSDRILDYEAKFLQSAGETKSDLPAFVQTTQLWTDLKGIESANLNFGFEPNDFHPSNQIQKTFEFDVESLDFSSDLEFYRNDQGAFDIQLLKKNLEGKSLSHYEKIIEKCREAYFSNLDQQVLFSFAVIQAISFLDSGFIWRRQVANDLFQLKSEITDRNILNQVNETLKSIKYESTYNFDEILSILDLGVHESNFVSSIKVIPADLDELCLEHKIGKLEAQKIVRWLLREGFITKLWEGLSLKYISVSREELLTILRNEFQNRIIPVV